MILQTGGKMPSSSRKKIARAPGWKRFDWLYANYEDNDAAAAADDDDDADAEGDGGGREVKDGGAHKGAWDKNARIQVADIIIMIFLCFITNKTSVSLASRFHPGLTLGKSLSSGNENPITSLLTPHSSERKPFLAECLFLNRQSWLMLSLYIEDKLRKRKRSLQSIWQSTGKPICLCFERWWWWWQ